MRAAAPPGENVTTFSASEIDGWNPMATAPHGVAILARGWDWGKPGTEHHYSIVIYDNGRWKGVGNDTDWLYLTDWKPLS